MVQNHKTQIKTTSYKGLWIGISIIVLWFVALVFNLSYEINWKSPLTYVLILVQMQLFTGIFITAHDAMHGTVVPRNNRINNLIGTLCAFLFMFNSYKKLRPKHHEHHRFVATEGDPDFHKGNESFLPWFVSFAKEYVTLWQIIAVGVTFNLLSWVVPQENVFLYWVIPSILSMLQLFYFGTFLPHRGEHFNSHQSSSQSKNHVWAFISCYFFGYHYEHHDTPAVPWWRLWKQKN